VGRPLRDNARRLIPTNRLGARRRSYYGPVVKAFASIDPKAREALEADLHALLDKFNVAEDGTLVAHSEYLEVVITKRS
jgi:hypothetical protein